MSDQSSVSASVATITGAQLLELQQHFGALLKDGKSALECPSIFTYDQLEKAFEKYTQGEMDVMTLPTNLMVSLDLLGAPNLAAKQSFVHDLPTKENYQTAIESYRSKCQMARSRMTTNEQFETFLRKESELYGTENVVDTCYFSMLALRDKYKRDLGALETDDSAERSSGSEEAQM